MGTKQPQEPPKNTHDGKPPMPPPPPKKWAEGKVGRVWYGREPMEIVREATAEVERLTAENQRLERALEKIANDCRKSQDHNWTVRIVRAMANLALLGEAVDD